jgi:hypothetical protein
LHKSNKRVNEQLNIDFKNISKHKKTNDAKKKQEESKKICDAKTTAVHVQCNNKRHVDVMRLH